MGSKQKKSGGENGGLEKLRRTARGRGVRTSAAAGRGFGGEHLAFVGKTSGVRRAAQTSGVSIFAERSRASLYDEFNSKYDTGKMLRRAGEGAFVYKMPGVSLSQVYLRWLAFVQLFFSYPQAGATLRDDAMLASQLPSSVMEMKPFALWQTRGKRRTSESSTVRSASGASSLVETNTSLPVDASASSRVDTNASSLADANAAPRADANVRRTRPVRLKRIARDTAAGDGADARRTHSVRLKRIARGRGDAATSSLAFEWQSTPREFERRSTRREFERRSTPREIAYAADNLWGADAGAFVYKSLGGVLSHVYLKWLASVRIFFPETRANESKASTQSLAHVIETKSFVFLQATGDEAATGRGFAADTRATIDAARSGDAGASRQRDAGAHASRFVTLRRFTPEVDFGDAWNALARRLDAPARFRTRVTSTGEDDARDAARLTRGDAPAERTPAANPYTPPLARQEIFVASPPRPEASARASRGAADLHWLMRRLSELDERAASNRHAEAHRTAVEAYRTAEAATTSYVYGARSGRGDVGDASFAATRSETWSLDKTERVGTFMLSLNGFKFLSRHEAAPGVVAADDATAGDARGRFARAFHAPLVRPAATQRREAEGEAMRGAAMSRALRRVEAQEASRGAAARAGSGEAFVYVGRPVGRDASRVFEMNAGGAFVRALDIFRRNFAPSKVAAAAQYATQGSSQVEFEFWPTVALPLVYDRAGAALATLAERAAHRASRAAAPLAQVRRATGDAYAYAYDGDGDGDAYPSHAARDAYVSDAPTHPDATARTNLFETRALTSLVLRGSRLSEKILEVWSRATGVGGQGLADAVGRKAAGMFVVVSGGARGAARPARVFGGVMDVAASFETADALMPFVSRELGARASREFEEEAEGRFEGIARTLVTLRGESPLRPPRTSYVFAQAQRPATSEPPPLSASSTRAVQQEMVEMVKREVQESIRTSTPPIRFSRADYTSIADQVYSTLMRRLMVERERLGLHVR